VTIEMIPTTVYRLHAIVDDFPHRDVDVDNLRVIFFLQGEGRHIAHPTQLLTPGWQSEGETSIVHELLTKREADTLQAYIDREWTKNGEPPIRWERTPMTPPVEHGYGVSAYPVGKLEEICLFTVDELPGCHVGLYYSVNDGHALIRRAGRPGPGLLFDDYCRTLSGDDYRAPHLWSRRKSW
jgi:hypothetical protein